MTKKDYILLAKALKDSKPEITNNPNDNYILFKAWNVTVENVAYALAKDNPQFDRNRFLNATGYND